MPDVMSAALTEALGSEFIRRHTTEAAQELEAMRIAEALPLLAAQPPERAADLVERLHPERAMELVQATKAPRLAELVPYLDLQFLAGLLARMDPDAREAALAAVGGPATAELKELMSFPEGTAGRLMDPRTLVFRQDETAGDVLASLRRRRGDVDEGVQIVDQEGRLIGPLAIQSLLGADPSTPASELVHSPVAVLSTAGLDEVQEVSSKTNSAIGVVDVDGRLLGVIRRSRLSSAAVEEASSDLQAMVGASRQERALSPPVFAVRKRLPWLLINLATAFLAAAVVGIFESTIAQVTALAVLLPVVAGQSGNSGSQALAVTMRGLALREVRISQWRRLGAKELLVGAVNGVAVALVTALGVIVWSGSAGLGIVIGAAMVISMALAGLAGAGIPLALKAFGQDPAQSSSIFLTTVTDIVGFVSFLGLATLFAHLL